MKKIHWPELRMLPVNLWLLASLPGPEEGISQEKPNKRANLTPTKINEVKNSIYQSRSSK